MARAAKVASMRAGASADGADTLVLASPLPARFRTAVAIGDVVHGGSHLGELEVLGQLHRVVAPDGAAGVVTALADASLARAPVEFGGGMLVAIDPAAQRGRGRDSPRARPATPPRATPPPALVFLRADERPLHYGRKARRQASAFVSVGTELRGGRDKIGLLEVMKTFHRVTYGGADLPPRARVRELLVGEGADVNAGDPLIALDAI